MPRGRKKKFRLKFDIKADVVRSVLSVVLIVTWLLSFIAFFAPDYSLNARLVEFWHQWFGTPALFGPFLLLLAGVFFIDRLHTRFKEPRILLGLVLFYAALLGFAHVFVPSDRSYDIAMNGEGGGLIGFYIASSLIASISKYGAVALLLASLIIALFILFNVSIDQIIEKLSTLAPHLAALKDLKSKVMPNGDGDGETDIEVTSGAMPFEDDDEEPMITPIQPAVQPHLPMDEEFNFEVVPSLSEPQHSQMQDDPAAVNTLITTAKVGALPYSDTIWKNPPLDLLSEYSDQKVDSGDPNARAKKIIETLKSFDIDVEIHDVKIGPSVTQYALKSESGVKVSKISGLQNDLAMALASPTGSVRIEAPIPGTQFIGIEVPNNTRAIVSFKSLMMSDPMKEVKSKLGIVLGRDVAGQVYVYDIGKMPHMLIAGTTGSGKSIFIHNLIMSVLFRSNPNEVKFILIDPKRVELIHYSDIPHLLIPVVTEMAKAPLALSWAVSEMERRYALFEKARVRNIEGYNKESGFQALSYIVIVVEELGELMQVDPNGVEKSIIRLAQLARATGIHLVLTVQRPDTKVITGLIKANIPCRVAFNVMSQIDSRVIIDQPGAEKLLGKGDMLFVPPDMSRPKRLQGAFIDEKEVASVVDYLKKLGGEPHYRDDILQPQTKAGNGSGTYGSDVDEMFDQAVEIVSIAGKASASLLQRKLSIGYARAARIIDELEENGIIGPADGQKPREVLGGVAVSHESVGMGTSAAGVSSGAGGGPGAGMPSPTNAQQQMRPRMAQEEDYLDQDTLRQVNSLNE